MLRKQGKSANWALDILLKGGVPLVFVLFGLACIAYAWFIPNGNFGHLILGFASSGVGAYLFYVSGKS